MMPTLAVEKGDGVPESFFVRRVEQFNSYMPLNILRVS